MTKWLPGWKNKNWVKSNGEEVLNVDLLQQLDAERGARRCVTDWLVSPCRQIRITPKTLTVVPSPPFTHAQARRVLWRHVKAHTGREDWESRWNDVADQEAKRQAMGLVPPRWNAEAR